MFDPTRRTLLEFQLQTALQQAYDRLLEQLVDRFGATGVSAADLRAYWEAARATLLDAVTANLIAGYAEGVTGAQGDMPQTIRAGVDWNLVNRNAQRWAERYGFDLVRGITDTKARRLQTLLPMYYERGNDLAWLTEQIAPMFGAQNARRISVTEITRSSVEGARKAVNDAARNDPSVRPIPLWFTSNDELVCPLCAPLHLQAFGVWYVYPPLHPYCRCWIAYQFETAGGLFGRSVLPGGLFSRAPLGASGLFTGAFA